MRSWFELPRHYISLWPPSHWSPCFSPFNSAAYPYSHLSVPTHESLLCLSPGNGKNLHLFWLVRSMLQAEEKASFKEVAVLFLSFFPSLPVFPPHFLPSLSPPFFPFSSPLFPFFFPYFLFFFPPFQPSLFPLLIHLQLDPTVLNRITLCSLKAHVRDKLCPKQLSCYSERGVGWEPNHREISEEIQA